jgi:flagellar protein FliL
MFKKKDKAKKGKEAEEAPDSAAAETPAAEGGEGADGAEGEAPKKKGLPIKLIAIGLAALLLVGGGGGGAAWFFLMKPKAGEAAHGAKDAHGKDKKKDKKKEKGGHGEGKDGEKTAGVLKEGPDGVFFYTLPPLMVNMQASDGRPTFLKLEVILELSDEALAEEIDPAMPRVEDMLQTFLRELRPEDLSGSQGTFRLRQEIQRRVNLMIAPAKVNTVLFGDVLIT